MERDVILEVEGMTCTACEHHVSAALEGAGARAVSADWRAGRARFRLPDGVAEEALRAAVAEAGYRPGRLEVVGPTAPSSTPQRAADHPERAADHPAAPTPSGAEDADLIVIGGGSAAFAAAITARDAGAEVILIEGGTIGGTCVNVGCVPSKALLRAAERYHQAGHHPFAGIRTAVQGVDLAALVAQKDELVAELRRAKYLDLIDAYGFRVIEGRARFRDPHTLEVDGRPLRARAVIVATGASPAVPPIPGLEEAGYLTSTTALELTRLPRRLAVIGANAIGLELGQYFLHLGVEVTFLDIAERVAPFEEPEASAAITRVLEEEGAAVWAPVRIDRVERDGDLRRIIADGGARTLEVDAVLVATGRRPNTAGLGLEHAGIEVDGRGGIVTDPTLRTANPRVWAAGDVVAGAPQFVYVAAYHGSLAARNAVTGAGEEVDLTGLPRVTFTAPQIAGAGLTEAQARAAGYEVTTSVLGLEHVPRALVDRDTRGVIKLVADATTRRLLGATVVADGAGDVIQSAVLAIRSGMTVEELAATFHPYLTMAEGLKLAAQTFDRDVARLSCCAA